MMTGDVLDFVSHTRIETPETNLLVACLREAVVLMLSNDPDLEKDRKQTRDWLTGEYDSEPGFSFVEMAETLHIDPDWLRSGILFLCEGAAASKMRARFKKVLVRGDRRQVVAPAKKRKKRRRK